MTDSPELENCYCPLDQDGQCLCCRDELLDGCRNALQDFRSFTTALELAGADGEPDIPAIKKTFSGKFNIYAACEECNLRYLDVAISSFVHLLGDCSHEFSECFVDGLCEAAREAGVKATPLVEKAWKDLCLRKKWF